MVVAILAQVEGQDQEALFPSGPLLEMKCLVDEMFINPAWRKCRIHMPPEALTLHDRHPSLLRSARQVSAIYL